VIDLILEPPASGRARPDLPVSYRVAGVPVRCDRALDALAPFRRRGVPVPISIDAPPRPGPAESASEVFRAPAWLGGRWRPVTCVADPEGYRIDLEGVGRFTVSAGGRTGRVERLDEGAAPGEIEEAALGPVLVLALALQGVWCLHASAVVAAEAGGAVALLGESGHGKSTLALALAEASPARWRLLADDVLPITEAGDGAVARPGFPQLKLAPERQPGPAAPEELPLRAVYLLAVPGGAGSERPHVRELSRREATLALIRHTVASRLFAPELLARHLAACGALAARVRAGRVAYPWTGELAEGLSDRLAADLEAA
jgi:hypothetical protein